MTSDERIARALRLLEAVEYLDTHKAGAVATRPGDAQHQTLEAALLALAQSERAMREWYEARAETCPRCGAPDVWCMCGEVAS